MRSQAARSGTTGTPRAGSRPNASARETIVKESKTRAWDLAFPTRADHFARRMKRVARWLVIVALLAAAAVGVGAWARTRKGTAVRYETVKADSGRIVAKVTATGTLS